jgi:hypothetical protein
MDERVEGWRQTHKEELLNLYASPNIIVKIKLGRKRWTGHVPMKGERRITCSLLVGNAD